MRHHGCSQHTGNSTSQRYPYNPVFFFKKENEKKRERELRLYHGKGHQNTANNRMFLIQAYRHNDQTGRYYAMIPTGNPPPPVNLASQQKRSQESPDFIFLFKISDPILINNR